MSDHPPTYQEATSTGSSSATSNRLQVAGGARTEIPLSHRRSMQDEARPLPDGWVRQYDPKLNHQFFVDTRANPPRSIWHHPHDDDTYLKSLSSEEREGIEELQRQKKPTRDDIIAAESDTENPDHEPPHLSSSSSQYHSGSSATDQQQGSHKFGRKLKDKLTSTTHEQRVAERQRRQEQEEEMYRRHLHIRQAMQTAFETGQPQLLGKDSAGHDVYMEPPRGGPYSQRGRQYFNPYSSGPYQQPNARFVPYPVPQTMYGRPYGYGYGYGRGGYGMGVPIMGGLLGGALLGGLLF